MPTKTPLRSLQRLLALCAAGLVAAALSACGGSGAGAAGSANNVATSSQAASLALISDKTQLASDGRETATLTAIVKSPTNVSLANQGVTFATTDPGVTLQVDRAVTDATGRVEATLSITDRSVRNVVVTARSGSIVEDISIAVVGTVLSVSGSSTIVFNAPTEFSVSLRDSGNNPVRDALVVVTSDGGLNTIRPALRSDGTRPPDIRTDAQGQAVFEVIGQVAGADTLRARSQGAEATFSAVVSGTQLVFGTPAPSAEVNVAAASTPVTVNLVENGAPASGQSIQFSLTRGSFVGPASAITDAAGNATVQIASTTSGVSTITATAPSGTTSTRRVEFVSTNPTKVNLQPSPAVVGANIEASGTNASQLIAVVRDANDNPVKGVRVNFTSVADPSNGRIEPGFGITDSFGTATVSFVAGPNPTGPGGVQVQASVVSANPITPATTTLTVSQLELSVRIGTGNEVAEEGVTAYRMPWVAIVADSSGNPVANALVTAAVEPVEFRKGFWTAGQTRWEIQPGNTTVCPSEDLNLNGRLDPGEDADSDGQLDPGGSTVARVTSASSRTEADGSAELDLLYPKSVGAWTRVRLRVTITTTAGTEDAAVETFWLPVLLEDIAVSVSPPGANAPASPYGSVLNCADPN